jgi:hypothetical protein
MRTLLEFLDGGSRHYTRPSRPMQRKPAQINIDSLQDLTKIMLKMINPEQIPSHVDLSSGKKTAPRKIRFPAPMQHKQFKTSACLECWHVTWYTMPTNSPNFQEISIVEYPWTNLNISWMRVIISAWGQTSGDYPIYASRCPVKNPSGFNLPRGVVGVNVVHIRSRRLVLYA